MIFLERIRELLLGLLPCKSARQSNTKIVNPCEDAPRANPWTRDLERLNCYTKEESSDRTVSAEMKIQLLMEQARLEKAKEVLKQQQQQQRITIGDAQTVKKPKRRTCDATLTDTKAWWGQSVATWDPDDAKNLGPQGEIKHPRQHKWFTQ
jgi:hypothetical protein